MFFRRIILLAFLQLFEGHLDKIRLQKLLFLFANKQPEAEYDFIPYKFSCYCYPANADKTAMIARNFIIENAKPRTLEELPWRISYVKNQFLGYGIPCVEKVKDKNYFTDFIVKCKGKDGNIKNLMIEISGFIKDKAEMRWVVENRWLRAVNALKVKYEYPELHFVEIAYDMRNIKNQLIEKIQNIFV